MRRSQFEPMDQYIPEGERGSAQIVHFEVSQQDSDRTAMRAAFGRPETFVPAGRYVRLMVNGEVMMSDTPMERDTNQKFLDAAAGDILIAGLGIGMLLVPLFKSRKVRSITVIEKNSDVISLVSPALVDLGFKGFASGKYQVIPESIFDWNPPRGARYDTIYFDIWPNITTDNLPDIEALHKKFGAYKTKGGFLDSWQRDNLLMLKSRYR